MVFRQSQTFSGSSGSHKPFEMCKLPVWGASCDCRSAILCIVMKTIDSTDGSGTVPPPPAMWAVKYTNNKDKTHHSTTSIRLSYYLFKGFSYILIVNSPGVSSSCVLHELCFLQCYTDL